MNVLLSSLLLFIPGFISEGIYFHERKIESSVFQRIVNAFGFSLIILILNSLLLKLRGWGNEVSLVYSLTLTNNLVIKLGLSSLFFAVFLPSIILALIELKNQIRNKLYVKK